MDNYSTVLKGIIFQKDNRCFSNKIKRCLITFTATEAKKCTFKNALGRGESAGGGSPGQGELKGSNLFNIVVLSISGFSCVSAIYYENSGMEIL